jgi:hypothetical protein
MSDEIKRLSEQARKKKPQSIADAIKRAKAHIRNVGAENLEEPDGFASGDMKKFLANPEVYEKEDEGKQRWQTLKSQPNH